jgi:hypothetical protein
MKEEGNYGGLHHKKAVLDPVFGVFYSRSRHCGFALRSF